MIKPVHLTSTQLVYFEELLIEQGYIKPNGEPIKCSCGSTHLGQVVIDIEMSGYINEYSVVCNNCGKPIAYWAYGSYRSNNLTCENYTDIMAQVVGPLTYIRWTWEGVIRQTLNSARKKIKFGAKKPLRKGN